MTHYIDADRLKAEIERRESEIKSQIAELGNFESNEIGLFNYLDLYNDILSLIDSLQQEQPQVADASKMEPGVDLEKEIKRYTEEKYNETFGNGQGTLDEFDWEDIAVTIEETAVHFVGWKEKAPEYKTISKILALGFMDYLDDNRQEWKMCLSNAECEDITKAVSEQDWKKLERYAEKYARHFAERGAEHLRDSKKMIPEGLEKAARHVYESWMGGTMDDVRRDMVELGTALNARKED